MFENIFEPIMQFYFGIFTFVFSPLLGLDPLIAEASIAIILIVITTSFYKFMVDQDAMKKLKEEQQALNKKAKEVQKEDPEKSQKLMGEALKLANKQMKMNMRPMMAALGIFVLFFPWLSHTFLATVYIPLPIALPLFGEELGWLGYYIFLSLPTSMIVRKLMGIN